MIAAAIWLGGLWFILSKPVNWTGVFLLAVLLVAWHVSAHLWFHVPDAAKQKLDRVTALAFLAFLLLAALKGLSLL